MSLRAAVTLLCLAFTSCASARPVEQVASKMSGETDRLEEREQSLGGFTGVAKVLLKNGGEAPVKATRASYEVVVGGKVLQKGELPLSGEVPAGGELTVEVPVPIVYAKDEAELAAVIEKKEPFDYALRGVIATGGGPVEFAKRSVVRAPRMPIVKLDEVEAMNSNSEGLSVNAFVDVENPNPFPLALKGLTWKLAVGGQPAADGVTGGKDVIKPASHIRYELTSTIDPAKVKERKDLIQNNAVSYGLEGQLELGITRVPVEGSGTSKLLRTAD